MSTHPAPAPGIPAFGELAARLTELSLRDAHRLGRRLEGARKIRKPEARDAVLAEIEAEVGKAEVRMAERRVRVPAVTYPEQLPVLAELLPQIETPVTIINGRHDPVVPLTNAEFLDERLPNSQLVIIDAGHFVWEEAPSEYAATVLDSIT